MPPRKKKSVDAIKKALHMNEVRQARKAAENKDAVTEPQQKLDPLEKIFLFQSQNVATPQKEVVEIKKECPDEFETNTNKLDLELDVEFDPRTKVNRKLQSLVIDNVIPEESTSSYKRSARLKMKEIKNQEKILQEIQAKNQRKENDQQEIEDPNVEDTKQENQDNEQETAEDKINKEDADELVNQSNVIFFLENEQQQELEIKKEDQSELEFEEQSLKPKDSNRIVNDKVEKENERHNDQIKELDTLQHFDLLIEQKSVPNVEIDKVKRKRGRPRKSLDIITPVVTEKRNITPVVTEKRKRGRPRKPRNVTNETPNGKRKRGRPRKPIDNQSQISQRVNIPIAPIQEDNEEDSEEEYTVFISEEVMEDPIHLEIQGVIDFLT